jgi:aminoglycoside phosphotransferase
VHAPDLDAVFWSFPHDRRIAALPLLSPGSPTLARLLGRACPRTRLVAYAAERAASARCLDARGAVVAYVKVHAGDGWERERRGLEALAADPRLRVPKVLASAPEHGALALEPLPGRRLDELHGAELAGALHGLGRALATLHAGGPAGPARFVRLDVDRLARAVSVIARARPAAGRPAALLLAALLAGRPEAPDVCLHGDVNLRNAILDGDRVALLDLEDMATGPASADLGQLLASLLTARVQGRLAEPDRRALQAAVLAGYATIARPPGDAELRWFTAASVLARVALPAVNRVREDVLEDLEALLTAAEALP